MVLFSSLKAFRLLFLSCRRKSLHLEGRVLHGTTFLHSPFTIIFVLTFSVSVRYMQKYLLRFKGERKTHGLGSNRFFHDVKHKFKGKLLPSVASFSCVTQLCVLSYHGYTSHSSDDSSLLSAVQLKCILHVTDQQYASKSNTSSLEQGQVHLGSWISRARVKGVFILCIF